MKCAICGKPKCESSYHFCATHREKWLSDKGRNITRFKIEQREAMMAYGLEVPMCVNSRRCEDPC